MTNDTHIDIKYSGDEKSIFTITILSKYLDKNISIDFNVGQQYVTTSGVYTMDTKNNSHTVQLSMCDIIEAIVSKFETNMQNTVDDNIMVDVLLNKRMLVVLCAKIKNKDETMDIEIIGNTILLIPYKLDTFYNNDLNTITYYDLESVKNMFINIFDFLSKSLVSIKHVLETLQENMDNEQND